MIQKSTTGQFREQKVPETTPLSNADSGGSYVASRKKILARLRSQPLPAPPLPEVILGNWLRYEDPCSQLKLVLESVGGTCESAANETEILERLLRYEQYKNAKNILSVVDAIHGNVDLQQVEQPHDLENIDFMIVNGEMAVAENGAVWVTDKHLRHRVAFFITQHLVMIVRKRDVLNNMHEAYARLSFGHREFGCFISGPSKTADIEQSLVIGAHGCRTMQLYLIDD